MTHIICTNKTCVEKCCFVVCTLFTCIIVTLYIDDDDQPLYRDSGNHDDSEDDDAPLDLSKPLN